MSEQVLDQIDQAVDAWEARPESWVPGDLLYDRPTRGAWFGEQHVRPMFELLPEQIRVPVARCEPCQVSWLGLDPCWVCGEERPPVGMVLGLGAVTVTSVINEAFSTVGLLACRAEEVRREPRRLWSRGGRR